MKRREFLAGGVGLASCTLLPTGCNWHDAPAGPYPPAIAKLVDVHCHVFNGSDLPSIRFLKIVVAKAYPKEAVRVLDIDDPDLLDGLIAILTWIVGRTRAPTARQEIKVLDRAAAKDERNVAGRTNESAVIDALAEMVADGSISVSDDVSPRAMRKVRSAIFQAAGEDAVGASDADLTPPEARAVAEKAYRSSFDLGILLRWFALFTRYRHVLTEQLANDYQAQAFEPQLLCPAIIDYDYWLGQYLDESPLPDQVSVMGRIARRKTGPVVHGYVGYDPLRQVAYELGKAQQFDPMQLVQRAIGEEGFLGVKLYPPMGFRASGNALDKCQTYPDLDIIREIAGSAPDGTNYDTCSPRPIDGSVIVGRRLDAAMEKVHAFCAREGACVIAHANNSNGSNKAYGKRADPAYWLDVFRRWPDLHVTLAHFGSFDARSAAASGAATGGTIPIEDTWEWTLGRYLKDHPQAPVFADVSFLTEIAGRSPGELAEYGKKVRRWIDAFDPRCEHLLYGSDWLMLGADPAYKGYIRTVHGFFQGVVGLDATQMERLLSANAGVFLGLREGDKARARLERFYDAHGIARERLPKFRGGP